MKPPASFFAALALASSGHHRRPCRWRPRRRPRPPAPTRRHRGRPAAYGLVAKPDTLTLYLRDHGKPARTEGVGAKLTLLNGTENPRLCWRPRARASSKQRAPSRWLLAPRWWHW